MAKKITIQHYYTTGSTAPDASALTLGEVAIATSAGTEAIFIKNNTGTIVDFPTRKQIVDYVDLKTKGIATSGEIETLDNKISGHITGLSSADNFGHVKLVGGDLDWATGNTITSGEAAASYHTHGQYLERTSLNTNDGGLKKTPGFNGTPASYGVKAGTGITVDSNGVSIIEEYQTKIENGATAYSWGDHKNGGYAKNDDLTTLRNSVTAHTGNTSIHLTTKQKDTWDNAANAINAFLDDNAAISGAVDTLKEIQEFLTGDNGTVQTLLDNLSALTDTVSTNTDSISDLNTDVNMLKDNSASYIKTLMGDDHIKVAKLTGTTTTQAWALTHKPASTQASAITATNNVTGFSFGSNFSFVNRIGYDANGHIVSGSTVTLKLPELPTADADTAGIVKIQHGALGIEEELLPNPTGIAADVSHYHTQYVKYNDLTNYNGSEPLVISCGTY